LANDVLPIYDEVTMTYKGHIKNGTVIFDEPIQLPEGTAVEIALRLAEPSAQDSTFYDRFADIIGSCPDLPPATPLPLSDLLRQVAGRGKDLPADGSAQHDHYIYGTPKR